MDKIRIRPSSIATFVSCPRQWYQVFVLGKYSVPSVRAAMGTGIHAGVEAMWTEAIKDKNKNPNIPMMTDAAIESYDKEVKESDGRMKYDVDMDDDLARLAIAKGTKAFVDDIVPYTAIPKAVEKRYTVAIDHCMVKDISGTVDYIGKECIADVKTSKRKIIANSHTIQQSIYKYLAEQNGETIKRNLIQGVILQKTKTVGSIEEMTTNVDQAKFLINNLLDKLDVLNEGKVDPDILFPGNPKHFLCSDMYCNLRPTCPFVHGSKVA